MKNITNVLEYLEYNVSRFPDKTAYVDDKNSYTLSWGCGERALTPVP